ncbi:MAG: hypothetical protein LUD77_11185 [Clostridiales bacterium]|nr:hypothetical protein [Clostridiales bacterium]
MENLRELLNIYFSEDMEDKTSDSVNGAGDIFESKYENIFNTLNKEEKYITNVFENILKEGKNELSAVGGSERLIERAYEGIGKTGGVSALAYYNYDTYEPEEHSVKSETGENIIKGSDYANNETNIVNESKYSGNNENYDSVLKLYNETEKANYSDSEGIFNISQRGADTNIYGGSEHNRFESSINANQKIQS